MILGITGSASPVRFVPRPSDDPHSDDPTSASPATSSDGKQPYSQQTDSGAPSPGSPHSARAAGSYPLRGRCGAVQSCLPPRCSCGRVGGQAAREAPGGCPRSLTRSCRSRPDAAWLETPSRTRQCAGTGLLAMPPGGSRRSRCSPGPALPPADPCGTADSLRPPRQVSGAATAGLACERTDRAGGQVHGLRADL